MSNELLVIALGGNAIKQADQQGTTEEQMRNVDITAQQIARIAKEGYRLAITHGNGPQAGALLIQQEEAAELVAPQTLAACGAMTQGQIGWMMQSRLAHRLQEAGIQRPVCTVVTQVVVDRKDPDFADPTKPVGPFYSRDEALRLQQEKGYVVKEVKPGNHRGWRRVVGSPEPLDIVEREAIGLLVRSGVVVVASGGGGIPVAADGQQGYVGVEAVIDKDRAGFQLAKALNADCFLILTDVDRAYLHYGRPEQQPLERLSADEAEAHLRDGHFLMGSMGPKIQAAVRFVRWSGKPAVIASLNQAAEALAGKAGTRIVA